MPIHPPLIVLLAVAGAFMASSPAVAQGSKKGVGGKTACALLSAAEIKSATGRNDVARSPGNAEELEFASNCQYWGAVDITIHLGTQTKVMFARQRDTYSKAPARLGYRVEPIAGLGDDAYSLSYSGKAEVRAMVGETELVVSLSGSLPPETEAKTMAQSLAKAAVAKLR
jgi:hypothetical protein